MESLRCATAEDSFLWDCSSVGDKQQRQFHLLIPSEPQPLGAPPTALAGDSTSCFCSFSIVFAFPILLLPFCILDVVGSVHSPTEAQLPIQFQSPVRFYGVLWKTPKLDPLVLQRKSSRKFPLPISIPRPRPPANLQTGSPLLFRLPRTLKSCPWISVLHIYLCSPFTPLLLSSRSKSLLFLKHINQVGL